MISDGTEYARKWFSKCAFMFSGRFDKMYDEALASVMAYRDVPGTSSSRILTNCQRLANLAITIDHPELSWCEIGSDNGLHCLSEDASKRQQREIDAVIERFVASANGKSDADKVYSCVDFVTSHVTKMRGGDQTIYALVSGNGEYVAFPKSVRYLLGLVGVPCAIIIGTFDHISMNGKLGYWNAVEIDGKVCYLDASGERTLADDDDTSCEALDDAKLPLCRSNQTMRDFGYIPLYGFGDGTDEFAR